MELLGSSSTEKDLGVLVDKLPRSQHCGLMAKRTMVSWSARRTA